MNRLPLETRAKIIGMMVEGNSLRSISRMCDVSINTVSKLLVDLGKAAMEFHDDVVRGLRVRRLQCDEIWAFVGAKKKNVTLEQQADGWGDVWTWTAIDADSKLCVSYMVGGRDASWANDFMEDCASRITRMSMRRFTRLTNGFSKKFDNHAYAVAIHFLYYNFGRVHKTLRVAPAMEAGIADHVWTLEEIAALAN